jgi:glutathione S-transferase
MCGVKAAQFAQDKLWDPLWCETAEETTIKVRMKAKDPVVTLYSSWFCPFAQRAFIALEEAQVNYKWVEINPYEVDPNEPGGYTKKALSLEEKRKLYPDFIEASPRGLVPGIRDNSGAVWESMPLAEYVDAVYRNGALLPRNEPYTCAKIQIWSAHCTERIQKAYYAALMAQAPQERNDSVELFYHECRALAGAMHDSGPFFLGNRFGTVLAAIYLGWRTLLWVGIPKG